MFNEYPMLSKLIGSYHIAWKWLIGFFIANLFFIRHINKRLNKSPAGRNGAEKRPVLLPKKYFFAITVLIVVLLFFQIKGLDKEDIDIMESFNVVCARAMNELSTWDILLTWAHLPLHPLFLSFLMKYASYEQWIFIFRLISVYFAIFSSLLVFNFSLKIFKDRKIAFASFIILSVHSLCFFYSRRTELYAMLCFVSLLSQYYFWQTFIANNRKTVWQYSLATIIGFFMHFVMGFVVLAQIAAIFWLNRLKIITRQQVLRFLKALGLLNALFIIFAPVIYTSLLGNYSWYEPWGNMFYLNSSYLSSVIMNLILLLFGFPFTSIIMFLLFFLLVIIGRRMQQEYPAFFILCASNFLAATLFAACFFSRMWAKTGTCYFNPRHFIWLVPFVSITYAYGLSLLKSEKISRFRRLFILIAVSFVVVYNLYINAQILLKPLTPAYRKSLYFIKENYKIGDYIAWPVDWLGGVMTFYGPRIIPAARNHGKELTPFNVMAKIKKYKRFWVIIPREDYFGIPHMNPETLDAYMNFLKSKFAILSVWEFNKIKLYLCLPKGRERT